LPRVISVIRRVAVCAITSARQSKGFHFSNLLI
jgi:hypothetical protein